ncbi:MAG: zeta toxin family protein [Gammaproteobacteria bacterium]
MDTHSKPQIFMIAGPNGAGKTTSAMYLLPNIIHCKEYINADAIASGLSPFNTAKMAIQAGRIMLERIHQLAHQKQDFAFETTGASKSFLPFLVACKNSGYEVNLLYLWLKSPKLALERVASRVKKGGHDIPTDTVVRRYKSGLQNILNLYLPQMNTWFFYDNSEDQPIKVAENNEHSGLLIHDKLTWKKCLEAAK